MILSTGKLTSFMTIYDVVTHSDFFLPYEKSLHKIAQPAKMAVLSFLKWG